MQIRYEMNQQSYLKVKSFPFMYWATPNIIDLFSETSISDVAFSCKGLDTCDNDTFVRSWYEVSSNKIGFEINKSENTFKHKWFPYCKGGDYRKWYGNFEKIVLWENDGEILRNFRDSNGKIKSRPQNIRYYFNEGLTFNGISSSYRALRYMNNCIFGGGGNGLFTNKVNDLYCIEGLVNSNVASTLFAFLNPSLNFLVGDLLRIPYSKDIKDNENIISLAKSNTSVSKEDWDSFETSWDFKKHPLI